MMLPRKRQRPNPTDSSSSSVASSSTSPAVSTSGQQQPVLGHSQMPPPPPPRAEKSDTASEGSARDKQVRKVPSLYGSWPRISKASASTSVTQETIFGGTVKSKRRSDLSRFDSRKPDDTASLNSTAAGNGPSTPKTAESSVNQPEQSANTDETKAAQPDQDITTSSELLTQDNANPDQPAQAPAPTQAATPSSPWLGWFSKTPFTETQAVPTGTMTNPDADTPKDPPKETEESQKDPTQDQPTTEQATESQEAEQAKDDAAKASAAARPASGTWFSLWPLGDAKPSVEPPPDSKMESATGQESEDVTMEDAPPPAPDPTPQKQEPAPQAGSTWAFWSRDTPKTQGKSAELESGEIAVIGEGSETHPTPMAEDTVSGTASKDEAKDKEVKPKSSWRRSKRLRPSSIEIDSTPPSPSNGTVTPASDQNSTTGTQQEIQPASPAPKVDPSSKSIAGTESPAKLPPNLLLPSFSSTYQMKENPTILQQITQLLLRTSQPPANHVFRVSDPPKIKKAIAIGVHGLFPAMYLRPMIGQPTGTSLRFANLCADSIRRWAESHGCGDCEIEKVALEGEGRINERVDNLWKLMLNWIDHIREADLVIIACHSQGVPVSVMLLEKLLDLGIITKAKIGVCAMAGVGLGPFPEYKSSIFIGSAAELWEFGNPQSSNSQRFEAALKSVLDYGARITFIGSIDDQVVPMVSAVYSPASHPYIYRAVFIDGRTHAPDFIAHLVGFALKLRNLGVSDHSLIRELSIPLAGSLYSGEGHSRLYYDDAVYDLAVAHALETTDVPRSSSTAAAVAPFQVQSRETLATPNPYVLPWIMRGLLEEDFVKTELSSETEELLRQFDDWKPTNKALKDVKYRLEAVRSKL